MQQHSDESDLFIGVDGGQSTTLTVLADGQGSIMSSAVTGPCNHIHEPGGLERQYRALRQGYDAVFAGIGRPVGRVRGVYLGLTGSGHKPTVESVYEADSITVASDLITALSGAIPDMQGVIVIAGTGSAAYGQNPDGRTAVAGGHGFYAGDEGSAADIARLAFRAVFQSKDGRGPSTTLTRRLLDYYDCADLPAMRKRIYGDLSRDQLAKAAGVVGQAAAEDGDAVAISLLEHAGLELGRLVAASLRQLDWLDSPVPVAPIGGVFHNGSLVTTPMIAHIHQTNPAAFMQAPRFQPVIGALLLAYRTVGIPVTPTIVENLDRTRHHFVAKN